MLQTKIIYSWEKKNTYKIKVKKLKEHHLRRISITNLSLVYLEIAFFAIGSCWYQAWKSASPFECLSERSLAITKMSIEIFLGGRQAKRSFSSRHFCKICKGRNFASRMFWKCFHCWNRFHSVTLMWLTEQNQEPRQNGDKDTEGWLYRWEK